MVQGWSGTLGPHVYWSACCWFGPIKCHVYNVWEGEECEPLISFPTRGLGEPFDWGAVRELSCLDNLVSADEFKELYPHYR